MIHDTPLPITTISNNVLDNFIKIHKKNIQLARENGATLIYFR